MAEKVGTNSGKQAALDEALKKLNNAKSGALASDTGTLLARLGDKPRDVKTISTGSLVLDSILGGGLPVGRLIEIFGPEASGKTSIALTAVANVQRAGGTAVFVDLENALDPRYAKKLGVDTDNLVVSQPDHAEQALELVIQLAEMGVADIIVVDSIAAMVPKAELEGDAETITIGLVARLMSKSLRKLVQFATRSETTVIFINQERDAIGGYSPMGTPKTTPGGKAMRFFASQRIEVRGLQQVKDGKVAIGKEVRLTVKKNKIAPPFGVGTTIMTFNRGINRAAEVIEVGKDLGVYEMPNNRTYIEVGATEPFARSKADAVAAVEQDEELFGRLTERLKNILADGGEIEAPVSNPDDEDDENDD